MVGGMPVAREKNREPLRMEVVQIAQEDRDDLVASVDTQRAAREEIVLNVCEKQGVIGCEGLHRVVAISSTGFLREQADIGDDIFHLSIRELATPRVHGTEDDAMLDRAQ